MAIDPIWLTRFTKVITALCSSYRQELDEATLEGYRFGLDDLPIERIEQAARRAIRERKFMPSAHELRELAGDMPPDARAQVAWTAVCEAVKRVTYYGSPAFDDDLTTAAINAVWPAGWTACCDAAADGGKDWDVHARREFIAAYVRLSNSGASRSLLRPLVGFHDRENALKGYAQRHRKAFATGLPAPTRPLLVHGGKERETIPRPTPLLLKGIE